MSRTKARRYRELTHYPNVYQGPSPLPLPELFSKPQPLTLELACGRGEYSNTLGALFPERNFLGIDIKGERLWQAARVSQANNPTNVAFARFGLDLLEHYLSAQSVAEIWLVHPDPQPGRARQRLTHPKYLRKYFDLLPAQGTFRLKTDDLGFFRYTLQTLPAWFTLEAVTEDLYASALLTEHFGIKTNFETKALQKNKTIKYLRAHRKASPPAT